jgi:[acyl-carrier-protein] S-malonyltransferase
MLSDIAVKIPPIGVLHNVDVASHSAPDVIRAVLEKQLYSPVRWTDSILFMSQQGVSRFVECGPGRVLTGLNKRIVPACRTEAVFDPDSLIRALELVQ